MYQGSSSGLLVSFCPGPGNGWGNLTVPPASKEAVSPSKPILYSVFCRGGVGGWGGGPKSLLSEIPYEDSQADIKYIIIIIIYLVKTGHFMAFYI